MHAMQSFQPTEATLLLSFLLRTRSLLTTQKDVQRYKQNPSLINFSTTTADIRLSMQTSEEIQLRGLLQDESKAAKHEKETQLS